MLVTLIVDTTVWYDKIKYINKNKKMYTRKLLCPKCRIKVQTAENIYQRERRKQLKLKKNKQK